MKTSRTLVTLLTAASLLGVAACGEIGGGEDSEDAGSEQSEGGESEGED